MSRFPPLPKRALRYHGQRSRPCSCGRRADPRSSCIRCRNGFFGRIPVGQPGISASTFQITTGLYLIVVALLASAMGGYVAGRLRTRWSASIPTRSSSRYCSWLFGMGIRHGDRRRVVGRGGQQHRWRRIGGLAPGANVPVTAGAGSPLDYYVDALLRSNPAANPNTTDRYRSPRNRGYPDEGHC